MDQIVLVAVGLTNLITMIMIYLMRDTLKALAYNVQVIEKATNSLTDRLVATSKTEAHAAGVLEERDRVKN